MPTPELTHDPIRAASELREQLSSHSRRLGFFMGSGASMTAGLPGIKKLTSDVAAELNGINREKYDYILQGCGAKATVEDVLNKVRLIQEFLGNDGTKVIDNIGSNLANELDTGICGAITKILGVDPPKGLNPHLIWAQWIRYIRREQPVEIFTTNYDLLIERALEETNVPYFDGFVGGMEPFFVQDSVEADGGEKGREMYPPTGWTRLWKVHGSIGWRLHEVGGRKRIVRVLGSPTTAKGDLIIHPSRDKYLDSRKLPFMTYLDHLRKFLSSGECLLLVIGYSFRDEHLNATILEALRSNNRLAVTVLLHSSVTEDLLLCGKEFRNLSVFGSDGACIGGVRRKWSEPSPSSIGTDQASFWDSGKKLFTLGDFTQFATYLTKTLSMVDTRASSS